MASLLSLPQADPPFDGGVAPTVAKDRFTGVEEALARLAHQAASDMPDAPRAPASDRSVEAPTLGPADLRAPIASEQRAPGKRRTLARVAIVVCVGASAAWAWRSYGGPASDLIATWAPPSGWISAGPSADKPPAPQTPDPAAEQAAAPPAIETPAPPPAQAASQAALMAQPATTAANEPAAASAEHQQMETMARDLATLRQTVEQLAAGQEQLTRELAKLQAEKPHADNPPAEKPRTQRRVAAPAAPPIAAPARRPAAIAPLPPPAAPQVSTVSPLPPPPQPAPQIPPEQQSSAPPPLRPPMPVPQP